MQTADRWGGNMHFSGGGEGPPTGTRAHIMRKEDWALPDRLSDLIHANSALVLACSLVSTWKTRVCHVSPFEAARTPGRIDHVRGPKSTEAPGLVAVDEVGSEK